MSSRKIEEFETQSLVEDKKESVQVEGSVNIDLDQIEPSLVSGEEELLESVRSSRVSKAGANLEILIPEGQGTLEPKRMRRKRVGTPLGKGGSCGAVNCTLF